MLKWNDKIQKVHVIVTCCAVDDDVNSFDIN